jgi:hypothetical protein
MFFYVIQRWGWLDSCSRKFEDACSGIVFSVWAGLGYIPNSMNAYTLSVETCMNMMMLDSYSIVTKR